MENMELSAHTMHQSECISLNYCVLKLLDPLNLIVLVTNDQLQCHLPNSNPISLIHQRPLRPCRQELEIKVLTHLVFDICPL